MNYNVYIGYDEREDIAAEVCAYSIKKRLLFDEPDIWFLKSENIDTYTRPKEPNQSTDFTYTRFMIPSIEMYGQGMGKQFSVFCDCDFLFLEDISNLVYTVNKNKAVSVVKHPTYVPRTGIKMDGVEQHSMPRKNWASLMVFNNAHPSNRALTPEYVNTVMPGRKLHQFDWLQDDEIGSIPMEWNTLDDYYHLEHPKAIHYTDGGPWFIDYNDTMYAYKWIDEHDDYTNTRRYL